MSSHWPRFKSLNRSIRTQSRWRLQAKASYSEQRARHPLDASNRVGHRNARCLQSEESSGGYKKGTCPRALST